MKTSILNYSNYYKFVMATDFFISFMYLRMLIFDFWSVFIRFVYGLFMFPIMFMYSFVFKLFFFYFDVLGLMNFLVYYINYMLFNMYNNLNYYMYINLVKVLLYFKNMMAYATFFDSHFSLMRSVYFWLPKKFHFHDPMIYESAYPAMIILGLLNYVILFILFIL